ncbi:MAG: DUF6122 family protein [Bacteroidota bacterium]
MIHIALHVIVPLVVAVAIDRRGWRTTFVVLVGTMIVDADHLLADPIYDPARCSIGFHPLHTHPAIVSYVSLLAGGLYVARISKSAQTKQLARWGWLVALGLLIHMALDALDCVV